MEHFLKSFQTQETVFEDRLLAESELQNGSVGIILLATPRVTTPEVVRVEHSEGYFPLK